ncbi:concanavalin A-like lectin/glucanase domain-containing protein [Ilyonectria destructans]|nr:concanavalin A-like lectin/glucanase domain-containing protein [Ilyonectria sp. MPI-CAGE-AT-0026]KAH6988631.1 concanavalin A-like lectin/glucanase domain-containing protein [Ilyonectria destructans]
MFSSTIFLSLLFPLTITAQSCGTRCALYTLAWSDQFDGNAVDTSMWNYRTGPRLASYQRKENVEQIDGELIITQKKESYQGLNYTAGGLISVPNFHYGYFEAYVKLNKGGGWHNAFWLMCGNGSKTVYTNTHTEIDIFEIETSKPREMTNGMNFWLGNGNRARGFGSAHRPGKDITEWNLHSALWTEERVVFFENGKLVWDYTFGPQAWTHNYINIWLTTVANAAFGTDDSALPSSIRVGNVSYYQKDYYLTSSTLCFFDNPSSANCPSNAGYSETGSGWTTSSLSGYTKKLSTRYVTGSSNAAATWSLSSLKVSGTYDVSAFIVVYSNSDPKAKYQLLKNGQVVQEDIEIDQTTGVNRWAVIASNVTMNAGENWAVRVKASGVGSIRADTVKFIRTA